MVFSSFNYELLPLEVCLAREKVPVELRRICSKFCARLFRGKDPRTLSEREMRRFANPCKLPPLAWCDANRFASVYLVLEFHARNAEEVFTLLETKAVEVDKTDFGRRVRGRLEVLEKWFWFEFCKSNNRLYFGNLEFMIRTNIVLTPKLFQEFFDRLDDFFTCRIDLGIVSYKIGVK